MSKSDRKNPDRNDGVPRTLTTIPLTDPHALSVEPSIGELVKDATAQMSTLVRAVVELARAEITRDVKKGLTGSVFFISALVVLFYSTFFFFFFLAELLDTWLWRWVAFLIVFGIMVVVTVVLALFGYLKVRRIRGPQQTIESVKETRSAFTPGHDRSSATGARIRRRAGRPPIPRVGRWRHQIRRSPVSTVRGAIWTCTPTASGSTSSRQRPPTRSHHSFDSAAAGDHAARVRLVLVVMASPTPRLDRRPRGGGGFARLRR